MGNPARRAAATLTGIVVRDAALADLPEVSALERVCYADPWPASAFASLPDNARVFFQVAEAQSNGRIAGYVVAWYVMDEGELANLAVTPNQRGQGIGRTLLDAVLADAGGRDVRRVYLEVRESNIAARELYASREFEEVGRRKGYYRTPTEDALILRRTLTPGLP
jgi:[ribosomal protein S18]-alanine N-acetyltransferase